MALYESLTAQSTPEQIASAYKEFTGMVGGDTQDAQTRAVDYLSGLGIAAPTITQGYNQFLQPAQIANAPAVGVQGIGVNYDAPSTGVAPLYQGLTAASNPNDIAAAYSQFAGGTGGDTQQNQEQAVAFLQKLGVPDSVVTQGYNAYKGLDLTPGAAVLPQPTYEGLTSASTPEDIARAYYKFTGGTGGDTPENQREAVAYLQKLGVADPMIQGAYKDYGELAGLKSKFGVTDGVTAPAQEGILSGFKYAKDSGISEKDMEQVLGKDAFNTYKTGLADYAKTGIANILADKQLSFDEAREAVKFGRDYGYDAQKLADLTGTDKKVFDAIYKNYDDTTKRVVNSVLKADDVKTEGDQVGKALALQQKFGFTDEDLAKSTGLSLDQVKGYLDPVRNYEADYKKLVEDPNRSDEQTKAFLTASLKNPFLKEKLGDKLQPALDELNRPPRERILNQIGQQRNALGDKYYQGVFGDPQVIADVLEKKGVKSLADLGQKDKYKATQAEVQYTTAGGMPAQEIDNKFYVTEVFGDGDARYREVPKDQIKTTYGRNEFVQEGDGGYDRFVPLTKEEQATLKDGNYQKNVGTVVVNKKTGDELTDTTGQLAYQSSSGGLKEKKNYLTVQFAKDGTPVLIASSQKAGLGALVQDFAPMIAMALPFILPGLGAAISGMLPGAAVAASGATAAIAPTLINQALTQGIISGGLTTLGGGQFEKGFLSGAISPVISTGIGSLLPAGMDPNISKAITGTGTDVIKGALQGGDFGDLLGQGVLSGLTNYGLGEATKGLNLTPQQLNFATGIAAPLLQGQKVNPMKVISTLAQAGQQTQRAQP